MVGPCRPSRTVVQRAGCADDHRQCNSGHGDPSGVGGWFALDVEAVVAGVGSDTARGLTSGDAASRLARFGPNEITREKPPSMWAVALGSCATR